MRLPRHALILATLSGILVLQAAIPAQAALPLRAKQCGDVITRSFKLKNNLSCREDGLKIGASGITIDLNGKTIRGDGGDDDNGIENIDGFDRVVIMSNVNKPQAKIVGFHDGIKMGSGTNRNVIRRIEVQGSVADGIDIDGGGGNSVIRSRVRTSGENGVELAGNNATIDDSSVQASGENGIELSGGNATLRDVRVIAADEDGIVLRGSDATLLRVFTGLAQTGTQLEGDRSSIRKSRSVDNIVGGFHVIGSQNDLAGSKAIDNGDPSVGSQPQFFGIWVQGDSNTVELNIVRRIDGDGIVVEGILNTISLNEVCESSGANIVDNGTDTFLEGNVTNAVCPSA
jgi:hypothetical protein